MYSYLLLYLGAPCNEDGIDLPPGTPPPPPLPPPVDENGKRLSFFPYRDCEEFKLANFLFKCNQMPGTEIDELMQIWANMLADGQDPPFADHDDLCNIIDATILGDVPWRSFLITYSGENPEDGNIPPWMLKEYNIWFRDPKVVLQNQLANPDFKGEFDYAPYQKFDNNGEREWKDFMSANWSYQQAMRLTVFPFF
jgi:Plavaka transposase